MRGAVLTGFDVARAFLTVAITGFGSILQHKTATEGLCDHHLVPTYEFLTTLIQLIYG